MVPQELRAKPPQAQTSWAVHQLCPPEASSMQEETCAPDELEMDCELEEDPGEAPPPRRFSKAVEQDKSRQNKLEDLMIQNTFLLDE